MRGRMVLRTIRLGGWDPGLVRLLLLALALSAMVEPSVQKLRRWMRVRGSFAAGVVTTALLLVLGGGLVLLGLVAPFLIEGYPVFITKKVETGTTSLVVSIIGESGVLVGGFLLRYLVIVAALPLTMVVPML